MIFTSKDKERNILCTGISDKNKLFYLIIFILIRINFLSGQTPRDQLVLKNKNQITGTITYSDSNYILLKRADGSSERYNWTSFDTVTGYSYSQLFFSAATGFSNMHQYSTMLYRKLQESTFSLRFRAGKMKYGRRAHFAELNLFPSLLFYTTQLGYGYRRYIKSKYHQPDNYYIGTDIQLTTMKKNATYMNIDFCVGKEHYYQKKIRLFFELYMGRAMFNMNTNYSIGITGGIRMGKEYGNFYRHLNQNRRLP